MKNINVKMTTKTKSQFVTLMLNLLEYLNDKISEREFVSLSGAGLAFGWDNGVTDPSMILDIPMNLFTTLGYENEFVKWDSNLSQDEILEKVEKTLEKNVPAIYYGRGVNYSNLIVGVNDSHLILESSDGNLTKIVDWYDTFDALQFIGNKCRERLSGHSAYERICKWAQYFRVRTTSMLRDKKISHGWQAFPEMKKWLKKASWSDFEESNMNVKILRESGLDLFYYYRNNLYAYLWVLNCEFPGLVHLPALIELDAILQMTRNCQNLLDSKVLLEKKNHSRVEKSLRAIENTEHSLQWTLFMKYFIKKQSVGFEVESFEYIYLPAMIFVGFEGDEFADIAKRKEMMGKLNDHDEFQTDFNYELFLMHHCGKGVNEQWYGLWGKFMRNGAPIPEGFKTIEFVPFNDSPKGFPFFSAFAFAKFKGDIEKIHQKDGFDVDAMYDTTRNILLGDAVVIPYPEKYWYAEVFLDGCDNKSSGYLFSIGQSFDKADLMIKK